MHVNERNKVTESIHAGIPVNMTTLPQQLKKKGFATHHIGKVGYQGELASAQILMALARSCFAVARGHGEPQWQCPDCPRL